MCRERPEAKASKRRIFAERETPTKLLTKIDCLRGPLLRAGGGGGRRRWQQGGEMAEWEKEDERKHQFFTLE